ncbi:transcriptional regulator [Paenibacillus darwinianus]|uniref:Transcriptional regulator n=1 Tax=Paenibacillus darwinianus TaxID=1380763 RepID=A0A9W5RYM8_9BACL|nr:MarR family transcriptional regulator [Paenibacillus darwinianus]EXX84841.1 transcriptional regulator [Paenibacillus darwinianus]EXX85464.1 transcriptional regulator [Paenibacillus darwinianus]EXX85655.1 transcriptional regulator [Paenibacillus darwinianus]
MNDDRNEPNTPDDNGPEAVTETELSNLEDAFRRLQRKLVAEWNKDNRHGLTHTQAGILIKLEHYGPQKASTLAEMLSVTSGAITGIADKLLELGFIVRDRDEIDRRVVQLGISESGRAVVGTIMAKRREILNRMFSGLSRSEIVELTAIYEHILRNMEQNEAKTHAGN